MKHISIIAAKVILHPDFNKANLENNVAVVKLRENADLAADHINTVCSPSFPPMAWALAYAR